MTRSIKTLYPTNRATNRNVMSHKWRFPGVCRVTVQGCGRRTLLQPHKAQSECGSVHFSRVLVGMRRVFFHGVQSSRLSPSFQVVPGLTLPLSTYTAVVTDSLTPLAQKVRVRHHDILLFAHAGVYARWGDGAMSISKTPLAISQPSNRQSDVESPKTRQISELQR